MIETSLRGFMTGTLICMRTGYMPLTVRLSHGNPMREQVRDALKAKGGDFWDAILTKDSVIVVRKTDIIGKRRRVTEREWPVRRFKSLKGLVASRKVPRQVLMSLA